MVLKNMNKKEKTKKLLLTDFSQCTGLGMGKALVEDCHLLCNDAARFVHTYRYMIRQLDALSCVQ